MIAPLRRAVRGVVAIASIVAVAAGVTPACSRTPEIVASVPVAALPGHSAIALDTAPKEDLRLVPAEAYVRTYLLLFGGLVDHPAGALVPPLDVQKRARGGDGNQLFDTWDDFLGALGFPDYRNDLPRAGQTNALMVATFERIGVALCDRAVEHDLGGGPRGKKAPPPVAQRAIFAFDVPADPALTVAAFAPRFDVLHRTFLGYPLALAPTDRTTRFFALWTETRARHLAADAPKSRLSPEQVAWSAVCQGLVRHPEFHLY
jgi:hypothetical protein